MLISICLSKYKFHMEEAWATRDFRIQRRDSNENVA